MSQKRRTLREEVADVLSSFRDLYEKIDRLAKAVDELKERTQRVENHYHTHYGSAPYVTYPPTTYPSVPSPWPEIWCGGNTDRINADVLCSSET